MIRIQQLKLPVSHTKKELEQKILRTLKIKSSDLYNYEIVRRSIDARKKSELKFVYQIDVKVKEENAVLKSVSGNQISRMEKKEYHFPAPGTKVLKNRPVIIGSGPAGLFCAYMLSKHGYAPIVLERGEEAEKRKASVEKFWRCGILDPDSNVQFGEGGAGTFSDGKLNTTVKDTFGRNREVLRIFVECGAPKEILYDQKPHLGTDQLIGIITNMRKAIEAWGGEVRFRSKVTGFCMEDEKITGVIVNDTEILKAEVVVLAVGHSARDTFLCLSESQVAMEPKAFAVGVRVEHPQEMITKDQYGENAPDFLGAAPYKVTYQCENGRAVYSFCMCPGGYVVNASSEPGGTCVNGMSYSDRDGKNANSAMIVTVTPDDYTVYHEEGMPSALDGVAFQRMLERAAYQAGNGAVPVQLFGDFCSNSCSDQLGEVSPSICGSWKFANLRNVLPDFICEALIEGIQNTEEKLPGFSRSDALLSAVEARTSSPVRIVRNEELESISTGGLYPCGEGAGYAGGITSAGMDGIKTAEKICKKYMNFR
ncbi:MAG: NAD(P)/FAD-dependent oxidoreductase [Fusicatenibacter sp.]